MNSAQEPLPPGWAWTTLGEVVTLNPRPDRVRIRPNLQASFVPMKAVEALSGRMDTSRTRPAGELLKGYTYFEEGDIVAAKITPCMENGKVAIAHGLKNGIGFGSTEFHVIRMLPDMSQVYVLFYLLQERIRREARLNMTGAVGQLRVPVTFLYDLGFPLPPLPEQRRIVAKIEVLFSKLDAGVEELKKARAQLKRYRQSVLKAAFSGELTKEWRKARANRQEPIETARELLERIRKARANGEVGKSRRKYKEPPLLDTSDLPDLPEGWVWTTIGTACILINGRAFKPTEWAERGLPIVRIQNLNDPEAPYNYSDAPVDERYRIDDGQLLFAWSGTPGTSFGAHIWNKGRAVLNQHIFRVEVDENSIDKRYLMHAMNHDVATYILKAHGGAGLAHITKGRFEESSVGLPPLAEQQAIAAEIERRLSIADVQEKAIEAALRQAGRLRQSILKRAFQGKLVPQDPADEPATELLARIKAERARQAADRPQRRRRRAVR